MAPTNVPWPTSSSQSPAKWGYSNALGLRCNPLVANRTCHESHNVCSYCILTEAQCNFFTTTKSSVCPRSGAAGATLEMANRPNVSQSASFKVTASCLLDKDFTSCWAAHQCTPCHRGQWGPYSAYFRETPHPTLKPLDAWG